MFTIIISDIFSNVYTFFVFLDVICEALYKKGWIEMRISSRAKYGIAALVVIAQNQDASGVTTVISISEKLGISKIYLEQIFTLLKRSGLVSAVKGSQGGYHLTRPASSITALDALMALEHGLFEQAEEPVLGKSPEIEQVMNDCIFTKADAVLRSELQKITLDDLVVSVEKLSGEDNLMFYI